MIASAALVGEYGREIPMRAGEIIAIGSELLLGGRLDTNSFGLLDVLQGVRLRRPYLREAPAGFGLVRLVTAFTNNPGLAG